MLQGLSMCCSLCLELCLLVLSSQLKCHFSKGSLSWISDSNYLSSYSPIHLFCSLQRCDLLFISMAISLVKLLSRVWLFAAPWTVAYQVPLSMGFSRQGYWSGLPFPSPGIFLTQGSNPGLPHCRQMLYCLSQQGSPFNTDLNVCVPTWTVSPTRVWPFVSTFHLECFS